jgi:hypothetical protein
MPMYDKDEEGDSESDEDEEFVVKKTEKKPRTFAPFLESIVLKIRKIVTQFKNHANHDEILQKYAVMEFGTELKMIKDCPTRWNSLLDMLERFFKLKNCLFKATYDLKIPFDFSSGDFDTIELLIEPKTSKRRGETIMLP